LKICRRIRSVLRSVKTPSYVSFKSNGDVIHTILVENEYKNANAENKAAVTQNPIYGPKKQLGHLLSDEVLAEYFTKVNFQILDDHNFCKYFIKTDFGLHIQTSKDIVGILFRGPNEISFHKPGNQSYDRT
jgi:hypothetical protein